MFATLCQFAAVEQDRTATLFHSGVDGVLASGFPAPVSLWVYIEAAPNELVLGEHRVALRTVSSDGDNEIASGKLDLTAVGSVRLALPLQVTASKAERIEVRVSVGPLEASLSVDVQHGEGNG